MARPFRFWSSDRVKDPLDAGLRLPAHAVYLRWRFDAVDLHRLEFDLTIHNDPGGSVGEYFAPFDGSIGGAQAYGGLQTDVQHPDGHSTGKGAIFSTWWSFDAADTRIADDGFIQLGTHEGRFVGVRRNAAWTPGHWRLSYERSDAPEDLAGEHDWYDNYLTPLAGDTVGGERPEVAGERRWIGAMRFPRPDGTRARIGSSVTSFLEVYAGATRYREIADWHIDVMAYGNGKRAYRLATEYPAFPYALVPNCDAWFDPERGRVHVAMGPSVVNEHAPTLYLS